MVPNNSIVCSLALAFALAMHSVDVCPALAQDAPDEGIAALVDLLGQVDDPAFHLDILKGVNEALKGRRQVAMPGSWPDVYPKLAKSPSAEVREHARRLALVFGDKNALAALRDVLMNAAAKTDERIDALNALINAKAEGLAGPLQQLVADKAIRGEAIKALAAYDDPKTPDVVLKAYAGLSLPQRAAALNTLASRISYAKRLIKAIDDKTVPRSDVSADVVRRLRNFEDKTLTDAVTRLWGIVRDTPQAKKQRIEELTKLLTAQTDYQPDLPRGRALYAQTCAQCHLLFGSGGQIGPDITGSNRANLEYILQNVVDPNALIGQDYQAIDIETEDGARHLGIIEREDASAVSLKTTSGVVIIPKGEIFARQRSDKSMMPEGLLDAMQEHEIRDLIAYLASGSQIPMLATEANAAGLFNGKDLSNWDYDNGHWMVEDGVIIGASGGVKLKRPTALISHMIAGDFQLTMKVAPFGDTSVLNIFVRAVVDEHGNPSGPRIAGSHFVSGATQTVEVIARGDRVSATVNGKQVLSTDTPNVRGVLAFQFVPSKVLDVGIMDIELKVIPKK